MRSFFYFKNGDKREVVSSAILGIKLGDKFGTKWSVIESDI